MGRRSPTGARVAARRWCWSAAGSTTVRRTRCSCRRWPTSSPCTTTRAGAVAAAGTRRRTRCSVRSRTWRRCSTRPGARRTSSARPAVVRSRWRPPRPVCRSPASWCTTCRTASPGTRSDGGGRTAPSSTRRWPGDGPTRRSPRSCGWAARATTSSQVRGLRRSGTGCSRWRRPSPTTRRSSARAGLPRAASPASVRRRWCSRGPPPTRTCARSRSGSSRPQRTRWQRCCRTR